MSNSIGQPGFAELKHTTVDEIYGNGWWERNRDEVNRRFDWVFRYAVKGERILSRNKPNVNLSESVSWDRSSNPLIVILAEKPQPPTLRGIYGVDEVVIPVGWEWAEEWRGPKYGEAYAAIPGKFTCVYTCESHNPRFDPRLILRKRQPKVWFKAEEEKRPAMWNEWVWNDRTDEWSQMTWGSTKPYLCATRHEEPDNPTQTVTQADIDRLQKVNS